MAGRPAAGASSAPGVSTSTVPVLAAIASNAVTHDGAPLSLEKVLSVVRGRGAEGCRIPQLASSTTAHTSEDANGEAMPAGESNETWDDSLHLFLPAIGPLSIDE